MQLTASFIAIAAWTSMALAAGPAQAQVLVAVATCATLTPVNLDLISRVNGFRDSAMKGTMQYEAIERDYQQTNNLLAHDIDLNTCDRETADSLAIAIALYDTVSLINGDVTIEHTKWELMGLAQTSGSIGRIPQYDSTLVSWGVRHACEAIRENRWSFRFVLANDDALVQQVSNLIQFFAPEYSDVISNG